MEIPDELQSVGPEQEGHMRRFIFPSFLCLLAAMAGHRIAAQDQPATPSQSPSEGWARVMQLEPGQKIKLERTNGATVAGSFVQADSNSLTLRVAGNPATIIGRKEVERIRKKSRATGMLLGALIGAAGGGTVGAVGPKEGDESRAPYVGVGALLGAGIGAGIGSALGKDVTIYRQTRAERSPR